MNIRLANMMDLPSVMDLLQRVLPVMHADGNYQWNKDYPSEKTFIKDITHLNLFIVREDDKTIAAVAIDSFFPSEYSTVDWQSSPNSFTFHRMMVDPEYRGKGVAKSLFSYLENRGTLLGLKSLRVDTNEHNTAMLILFEELEYTPAGVIHFKGVDSDFLCFEKTLS